MTSNDEGLTVLARELCEALERAAQGFSNLSGAFGKYFHIEPMQTLADMCAASAGECRAAALKARAKMEQSI